MSNNEVCGRYADLYRKVVADHDRGKALSHRLAEQFPGLSPTYGWALLPGSLLPVSRWWCVAPDGSIVDPPYESEEVTYTEEKRSPLGECLVCGEFRFEVGTVTCSGTCAKALMSGERHGQHRRDLRKQRKHH